MDHIIKHDNKFYPGTPLFFHFIYFSTMAHTVQFIRGIRQNKIAETPKGVQSSLSEYGLHQTVNQDFM